MFGQGVGMEAADHVKKNLVFPTSRYLTNQKCPNPQYKISNYVQPPFPGFFLVPFPSAMLRRPMGSQQYMALKKKFLGVFFGCAEGKSWRSQQKFLACFALHFLPWSSSSLSSKHDETWWNMKSIWKTLDLWTSIGGKQGFIPATCSTRSCCHQWMLFTLLVNISVHWRWFNMMFMIDNSTIKHDLTILLDSSSGDSTPICSSLLKISASSDSTIAICKPA